MRPRDTLPTRPLRIALRPAQQIRLAFGFVLLAALVAGVVGAMGLSSAEELLAAGADPSTIAGALRRARTVVIAASALATLLGVLSCIALTIRIVRPLRRIADLERSNGDLQVFVQSVSHDLKAPLASVSGFLSMARHELDAGDLASAESLLGRAEAASSRADRLVHDLLDLARAGGQGAPTACDLRRAALEVLDDHGAALQERDVTVRLDETLGQVTMDPAALRQVLANVIGNAIKYGSRGPRPSLTLRAHSEGSQLILRVQDNGPGIPEGDRVRALELFQRLDPRVEGSGVGLALVQRAMHGAGGDVQLEETEGGGTTVLLRFRGAVGQVLPRSGIEPTILTAHRDHPTKLRVAAAGVTRDALDSTCKERATSSSGA